MAHFKGIFCQPTPKVKILTNTLTLAVDENLPIFLSDQTLFTPEEIKGILL
jgi:hypothetical protein